MPQSEQFKEKEPLQAEGVKEEEEQDATTKAMPGYLGGAYNGVCNVLNGALDRYLGTGEPISSSSTTIVESPIREEEVQKEQQTEQQQEAVTEGKVQDEKGDQPTKESEKIEKETEESNKLENANVQSTTEKAIEDVKQIAQQSYQSAGKTFEGVKQKIFEAYEKLSSSSKKQVNVSVQKIKEAAEASQKAIKRASMRPEKKKD